MAVKAKGVKLYSSQPHNTTDGQPTLEALREEPSEER